MRIGLIFGLIFLFVTCAGGQMADQPAPNRSSKDVEKGTGGAAVADASESDENEFAPEVQPAAYKRNLSSWFGVVLTPKDKQAVAMNQHDAVRFAEFLQQENTGFVRLYDAATCEMNLRILDVADDCPPNIRGRGIFYSFRKKKYQTGFFSDVKFYKNTLQMTGLNVLGFLVDLGDQPLDEISLAGEGIREMSDFAPTDDIEQIKSQFRSFAGGIRIGDFLYRSFLPLKENNTYALRTIAFQGKVFGRVGRFKINVLNDDKRQDVIIAFRVIRKHDNGSVSLLWRELQRKEAPKLDFKKRKKQNEPAK